LCLSTCFHLLRNDFYLTTNSNGKKAEFSIVGRSLANRDSLYLPNLSSIAFPDNSKDKFYVDIINSTAKTINGVDLKIKPLCKVVPNVNL
jgi:hypothetical protein